ncbi:hypothetical protein AUEXF2481DRAFT_623387 [Aureobasidium subglaciale EXF-2481]|uniref:Uncharacterized protein n=1 Tax=Aureobasidium subglaciale (strain EXF-2481) TaxID=1043005 RepID=A0A074YS83_AURSE|nr:uncharacterized protein AUEXF2481DRAFT_623387 [Aureobasidium subglaciale EXF-2481]KEQ96977.1 hypothetical protein AUEXF2481DRAFT_623387 [Aureobasidium subglaciale EXF-2481]
MLCNPESVPTQCSSPISKPAYLGDLLTVLLSVAVFSIVANKYCRQLRGVRTDQIEATSTEHCQRRTTYLQLPIHKRMLLSKDRCVNCTAATVRLIRIDRESRQWPSKVQRSSRL